SGGFAMTAVWIVMRFVAAVCSAQVGAAGAPPEAAASAPLATGASVAPQSDLPALLQQATRRVVKLYGAGIADEHGYATGVIVSPDGLVVTVLGLFLETTNLRAVSPDGHIYHAEPVYRDEYRQLALLRLNRYPENV